MKVLSYLEYSNSDWLARGAYEVAINHLTNNHDNEMGLFYSQPFKPELITELFEGWTYTEMYGGCYVHYDNGCLILYQVEYSLRLINHVTDKNNDVIYPSTLDRFICHCQDICIELFWRRK